MFKSSLIIINKQWIGITWSNSSAGKLPTSKTKYTTYKPSTWKTPAIQYTSDSCRAIFSKDSTITSMPKPHAIKWPKNPKSKTYNDFFHSPPSSPKPVRQSTRQCWETIVRLIAVMLHSRETDTGMRMWVQGRVSFERRSHRWTTAWVRITCTAWRSRVEEGWRTAGIKRRKSENLQKE